MRDKMKVSCEVTCKIQYIERRQQHMVDTNRLKGLIVENEKTQEEVARYIGITPKTFYSKMKRKVFGSDEIEKMIELLNIEDPTPIFFAK